MPDDLRTTIGQLPRDVGHGRTPKQLTAEQLEDLLEGDDLEPATRRNLQDKLDSLRHEEQRREQLNGMSTQEIVDSISREHR